VEKCFTITTEEADRVLAARKKSGKVLSVFQSEYSEST
jgi:predicted dehydrogenase